MTLQPAAGAQTPAAFQAEASPQALQTGEQPHARWEARVSKGGSVLRRDSQADTQRTILIF